MTTFTWKITHMGVILSQDTVQNVVQTIHWTLQATRDGITHEAYGTADLSAYDPAHFTPYENLTVEQVTQWVEQSLGGEQVNLIKQSLDDAITRQLTPSTASLVPPWEM